MKKIRCLVTGGTGFVGYNLVKELEKQGYEVIITGSEHENFKEVRDLIVGYDLFELDWEKIIRCLKTLEGTHFFDSFQTSGTDVKTTERTIIETSLKKPNKYNNCYTIEIKGVSFLKQMIRNIVGTVIDVGRGKMSEEYFSTILSYQDRSKAGQTAPAKGLFLDYVSYSDL